MFECIEELKYFWSGSLMPYFTVTVTINWDRRNAEDVLLTSEDKKKVRTDLPTIEW